MGAILGMFIVVVVGAISVRGLKFAVRLVNAIFNKFESWL